MGLLIYYIANPVHFSAFITDSKARGVDCVLQIYLKGLYNIYLSKDRQIISSLWTAALKNRAKERVVAGSNNFCDLLRKADSVDNQIFSYAKNFFIIVKNDDNSS